MFINLFNSPILLHNTFIPITINKSNKLNLNILNNQLINQTKLGIYEFKNLAFGICTYAVMTKEQGAV